MPDIIDHTCAHAGCIATALAGSSPASRIPACASSRPACGCGATGAMGRAEMAEDLGTTTVTDAEIEAIRRGRTDVDGQWSRRMQNQTERDRSTLLAAVDTLRRERDAAHAALALSKEALEIWESWGCPACSGDCASANRMNAGCPVQASAKARRAIPATLALEAQRERDAEVLPQRIANYVMEYVAELGDRTSPEDQPEMMLITGEELNAAVMAAFESEAALATPAPNAAGGGQNV